MNAPASHASPAFQQLERLVLSMPMAQTLGLRFTRIAPGEVELEIPVQEAFTFRHGQLQATPVFAIGDFAAVAILSGLPITLVFLAAQRWIVSGLTAGGVKG